MPPEIRLARVLGLLAAVAGAVFAAAAVFAAVVVPYRFWDSLAFGSWSRLIERGEVFPEDTPALFLQRPLFYVAQGLAWRWLGGEEWIGRLLSLAFAALLVWAVWALARRLSDEPAASRLLPPLAALVVLASSRVAWYATGGMTDVPVAALVAATGVLLWRGASGPGPAAATAALATAAVLAKPTALLAFAGLVPAVLFLRARKGLPGLAAAGVGMGIALGYDAWQAARLDESLADFLSSGGTSEIWLERGANARWAALGSGDWLGEGLRLVVTFGLAHGVARALGARPGVALQLGGLLAVVWSVAGTVGSGELPGAALVGTPVWLALVAAMLLAPFGAHVDPVTSRTYGALVVWLLPTAVIWWWFRADEIRLLSPAWTPLYLLAAAALASTLLGLARLRPAAALAPVVALALLALANLPAIDGLGRHGWAKVLEAGPSAWSDRPRMERLVLAEFLDEELRHARENVAESERIVTVDNRLAYFFPGQVRTTFARTCADLEGARLFTLFLNGIVLEAAHRAGQRTDPLAWLQCARPRLELVADLPRVHAVFVVGRPPARAPTLADCRIRPRPARLASAVLGRDLAYGEARTLLDRARGAGFGRARIERTACSRFRVVVRDAPADQRGWERLRTRAARADLVIELAPAVRYPEVPGDISAVR